jgi:6-phosphogluconolactonase (cycloisomerase 2 family)
MRSIRPYLYVPLPASVTLTNWWEERHVQPQNVLITCRRQHGHTWIGFRPADLPKVALYANVGADLTHYDVDVSGAELIMRETVTLPAGVQYAWPHASRRYLHVASSSSAPGYSTAGTEHYVTAFAVDQASGALTPHGAAIKLPTRPIHISTDIPSENILVAFNNPSAVRVYRINEDFTPGEEVEQPGPIDAGIFAHQVRVTPDNRLAILVTRGNEGTPTKAEDPGALKVFDYKNGVLTNEVGGKEFGPRHLDFHPTKPWIYVSIETQNKMYMLRMEDGRISPEIAYRAETLAEPNNIRARQAAGTVHVHPNGGKIREIVHDSKVAEMLSPSNVIGCKRLCVDTGYWETYNRPNVTLIDVSGEPIETITPAGIRARGREYAVDAIVFATGFDAMTGALLKIDIRGAGGQTLKEKWREGPKTYLRPRHRRLPKPLHDHGAGQPLGADQHAAVDRAARRMGGRLHRLSARQRPQPHRGPRRGRGELGSACPRSRRRLAALHLQLLVHRRQRPGPLCVRLKPC